MNKKIRLASLSTLVVTLPLVTAVSCVNGKPNQEYVAKANEEQTLINEVINAQSSSFTVQSNVVDLIDKNQNFTSDDIDKTQQIFDAMNFNYDWKEKVKNNYSYLFLIGNYKSQTDTMISSFEVNIRVIYNGTPNISSLDVVPFKIEINHSL